MFLKKILLVLFVAFFVQITSHAQKKKSGRSPEKVITVPDGINYQVINYRENDPQRATSVAITSQNDSVKNKPVVVFIHGGGWANGDKNNVQYQAFQVARKGFVGICISYRLISEADFPTCIYDVKEAIRFVKSKATQFSIDSDRIGVWGYSAGAHLALMTGLSPENAFKSELYTEFNSQVKSLMVVSAPTDFVTRVKTEGKMKIFNESQNESRNFQVEVSPLSYIDKNQLPIFMLHGTADALVKPYHYLNFQEKTMQEKINNFQLFEFENGGHMFYLKNQKEVQPIFEEFLKSIK